MNRRLIVGLALVFLLIAAVSFPVSAQDKTPACAPADLIKTLSALKTTGDQAKDMTALLKIQGQIQVQNIACNGLKWSGKNAKILGPFELPKGTYKSTLTTKGFFIADMAVISGECGYSGFMFYNIMQGQASEGSEQLLTSQGCKAVINTSNVTTAWTFTIEPLQ